MADRETFVQLRLAARHFAFGAFTAKRGRQADLLIESIVRRPQRQAFRSLAVIGGARDGEVRGLIDELQARYVAAMRPADGDGRLVFEIDHDHLPPDLYGVLLAFQASCGPAWMHFRGGRLVMRGQAAGGNPEECAQRLRQALSMAGIKATVSVVQVGGEDLKTWRALASWREAAELAPPPVPTPPAHKPGPPAQPR